MVVGTGKTPTVVSIAFPQTFLRSESIRKYKKIIAIHGGTTANHLLEISNGISKYFVPSNTLTKEKRSKRCMMRKARVLKMWQFSVILQELNNILPQFPGLD